MQGLVDVKVIEVSTHHPSFCVSGAICNSTFSFSDTCQLLIIWPLEQQSLPRSLMLNTPETVLLVLRWLIFDCLGEALPGSMAEAESTLDKGSPCCATSAIADSIMK